MLYKIDYTARGNGIESSGTKWVNNVADHVEATKRFMEWFFLAQPGCRVRMAGITEVELIGDLSGVDLIDEAVATPRKETPNE